MGMLPCCSLNNKGKAAQSLLQLRLDWRLSLEDELFSLQQQGEKQEEVKCP